MPGSGAGGSFGWQTKWDGVTLPYRPEPQPAASGCTGIMLYWRNPESQAIRVCVPDQRGNYTQLVRGVQYFEAPWGVLPIEELPPPPLMVTKKTQVYWEDLPVPPEHALSLHLVKHDDNNTPLQVDASQRLH